MKFIDEVMITVRAGDGGRGCVSFRRERFIPKGGPDGGDGGKGGDVILRATNGKRTLYHFKFKNHFKAENGKGGGGDQRTGKNGEDLILEVPVGTLVSDASTGQLLKDLKEHEEIFIVAEGGQGGRGNKRFASSVRRTPRFAQPGEPGRELSIKLELKLIADVGIIGLPNAGKSTLISKISSARPKIADYPFTTLTPTLGIVSVGTGPPFCVADIPGLIEGAHKGSGLGIRFLKHIERTNVLVHLIDAAGIDPENPLEPYETVNRELSLYCDQVYKKPQLVVLNKMDMADAQKRAGFFEAALGNIKVEKISALTGEGVASMIHKIADMLDKLNESGS